MVLFALSVGTAFAQDPAQVTLTDVPEGSTVMFTAGPNLNAVEMVRVGKGQGELDDKLGLKLSPAVPLEGLVAGEYSIKVLNPLLGELDSSFTAVAGSPLEHKVDYESMPNAAWVLDQRSAWKAGQRSGQVNKPLMWGGAGATAALLGLGAYGTVYAVQSAHLRDAALADVYAFAEAGDKVASDTALTQYHRYDANTKTGIVLLGSSAALAAGGGALFTVELTRLRRGAGPTAAWDPFSLQPPVASDKVEVDEGKLSLSETVTFRTGTAELEPRAHAVLDDVARVLKASPDIVRLEIQGHTDSVGDPAKNLALSQQRADAVRSYLLDHGVNPDQVVAKGYGDTQPVADNGTDAGRERNRRVEFVIVQKAGVDSRTDNANSEPRKRGAKKPAKGE